jgi:hypothetical protein
MKEFFKSIIALIFGISVLGVIAFFLILLPIWKGTNSYYPDGSIWNHMDGTSFNDALGTTVFIIIGSIILFFLYLKYKPENQNNQSSKNVIKQKKEPNIIVKEKSVEFQKEEPLQNKKIDFNTISNKDFQIVINTKDVPNTIIIVNKTTSEKVILKLLGSSWFGKREDGKICVFRTEANENNPFLSNEFELNREQFDNYCNDAERLFTSVDKLMNP